MLPLKRENRPMAEINVVPYIDVMLVLLVIFMVTAPLLTQGVLVDLPKAQAKSLTVTEAEPLVVSVDRVGRYYVNRGTRQEVPLAIAEVIQGVQAAQKLAEEKHQTLSVYVKGDAAVPYGQIAVLMAALQEAGIEKVGLVTEATEAKK